ncbi:hypothetical protein TREPR_0869 [Treponema primitia ZAS-2]|uniref:Uncharacterized protein n=1 Tax=Treponema primitia (strain ATCC BAA-887 / DSM 12427 / ZAS-2) TaxID=545694 RepID=F5YIM8_TREPZ|nr:hypothetical protein [Treponema primitia]AEF85624.1 hypothetical protein TREPR_0869 [Treponema primitia ZAS-2]
MVKINGEEIVIHAMKATKNVIDILKKLQRAGGSEGGPDGQD